VDFKNHCRKAGLLYDLKLETDGLMIQPGLHLRWHTPPIALRAVLILMGCAWVCAACSESRGPVSVKSDDPTLKIPAIKKDVQQKNTNDVPILVKNLSDDDPAVRFYAIEGLRRLTGDDLGYRYYDEAEQRQPALDRWNDWLKQHGGK